MKCTAKANGSMR